MTTTKLTQAQFSACNDKLSDLIRASRKDPAAKAAAAAMSAEWDRVLAMPQATADQRAVRFAAIADAAARLGLLP
jgi:hypothetical protein